MKAEELRSRSMLHFNKLDDFREGLKTQGWLWQEPKSIYEALRMTRKGKDSNKTLIVHQKDSATVHLTTWGESQVWLLKWLKERRNDIAK